MVDHEHRIAISMKGNDQRVATTYTDDGPVHHYVNGTEVVQFTDGCIRSRQTMPDGTVVELWA